MAERLSKAGLFEFRVSFAADLDFDFEGGVFFALGIVLGLFVQGFF